MMQSLLILSPILFSFVLLALNVSVRNIASIAFVIILGALSLINYISLSSPISIDFPHYLHYLFVLLDCLVLLFFLWSGVVKKHLLVTLLALVQITLYSGILFLKPTLFSSDILVDNLSSMMYIIINIVGGIIIIYALEYIESEKLSRMKKNGFISLLFPFLGVMNFIVSTNNIEVFFLLFELTTLFSYLLIGYRKDEVSMQNALQALWMNQLGGVAILLALLFSIVKYNTTYFDVLIANIDPTFLLPIVFLVIAAFVKGASVPFERWLLGAMVAPTPVSAILHSATMVKIAPYLILKLSVVMNGFVSITITIIGTFVFFTASLLALSKDYFKEILGLSTVALLALMMALAAVGSEQAMNAALILMVFHAISKALLFLQAGILEKSFHLKYVSDIDGLINHSPLVTFFIIIGFASLTLPPFGAFVAKFMAIESIAIEITKNPLYALVLIFIALGSVFLTLLYFKVLTKLFAKDLDYKQENVKISKYYTVPSFALLLLLIVGIYVIFTMDLLSGVELIIPLVLISLVPLFFATVTFKNAHRVKEYNCGEKEEIQLGMYYFNVSNKVQNLIRFVAILGIFILVVGVLL